MNSNGCLRWSSICPIRPWCGSLAAAEETSSCLLIKSVHLPLYFGRHYLSLFLTFLFFKISDACKTSFIFIRRWHFQSLGCAQSWHWFNLNNPLYMMSEPRSNHTKPRHVSGYKSMKLQRMFVGEKEKETVKLLSQSKNKSQSVWSLQEFASTPSKHYFVSTLMRITVKTFQNKIKKLKFLCSHIAFLPFFNC